MRLGVIAAMLALGCTSTAAIDGATIDGGGPDAASFDSGVDSGRCTDTPLTASCDFRGYGTMCGVPCSFPPGCTFDAVVTFVGSNYCCGDAEKFWHDCVCEDGHAQCRLASSTGPRRTPESTCESCSALPDAGSDAP